MKKLVLAVLSLWLLTGCASFWSLFAHDQEIIVKGPELPPVDNSPKRTTRQSLEEQSMLGESSGSLWVGRGQAAYLFTNNNQRLLGDMLVVALEGHPKEQIVNKANVISKLLTQILNEQTQEIKLKQEEWKKQMLPENQPKEEESNFLMRAIGSEEPKKEVPQVDPVAELKKSEKDLKEIGEEQAEIQSLAKANDFPIRSVPTRVVEITRDGNYKVRGEKPFMIGKREYKLLVMGTVRAEEYNEKGISAEILVDPTFDIIGEKQSEAL